jgi:hypothetical protein
MLLGKGKKSERATLIRGGKDLERGLFLATKKGQRVKVIFKY